LRLSDLAVKEKKGTFETTSSAFVQDLFYEKDLILNLWMAYNIFSLFTDILFRRFELLLIKIIFQRIHLFEKFVYPSCILPESVIKEILFIKVIFQQGILKKQVMKIWFV
jgi:hypothetical protein